jgi:hypothetical protein
MDVNVKDLLSDYFLTFCQKRKVFFKANWVSTIFGRIIDRDATAKKLLCVEIDFDTKAYGEFHSLVHEKSITREDVVDYSSSLKVLKDEITNRNTFIIISIAILTILVKVFETYALGYEGKMLADAFYGGASLVVIFYLLERGGLNKRGTAAAQLITIIDKWLTKNPEVRVEEKNNHLEVEIVATEMPIGVIKRWLGW